MKQKVLAYITRNNGNELLVFEHTDFPEAGIQVPAGTIETGENIEGALRREVEEESGLRIYSALRKLGSFQYFREDIKQHQIRHVFHVELEDSTPEEWCHIVNGHGVDENLNFKFFWLETNQAINRLAVGLGDYIQFL